MKREILNKRNINIKNITRNTMYQEKYKTDLKNYKTYSILNRTKKEKSEQKSITKTKMYKV